MIKVLNGKNRDKYTSNDITEYKTLLFDAHKNCINDIQIFFTLLGVNYEDFGYIYNMDIVIDFETDNPSNVCAFYLPSENNKKGCIHVMPDYLKRLVDYTRKVPYSVVIDNLNSTLIHESLHYNRDIILNSYEERPEVPSGFEEVVNETITQFILYHRRSSKIDIDGFYDWVIRNSKDKKELCIMAYLIKKYGLEFVKWYTLPSKDSIYVDKPKEYFKGEYETLVYYISQLFVNTYYGNEGNDELYNDTMYILKRKLN